MSFDSVQVDYIKPETLSEMIIANEKKIQVIDVRGRDFGEFGCCIKNAINIKTSVFIKEKTQEILEKYHSYDYIVIHCMRSQQRGPKCAKHLKSSFIYSKYYATSSVEIVILEGGFGRFYNKFYFTPQKDLLFDEIEETE